jgi:FAD/FMN-containing dehydrogenase
MIYTKHQQTGIRNILQQKKVVDVPAPLAIIYPESAEQVSEILRYCNVYA